MNVCECGCGGETKSRFVRGHHRRVPGAKPPRAAQSLDQRIRDNSEVTEDGHWLWQRRIDQSGYGQIKVNKRTRPVARVSHEVFIGEVPAGHIVHQTCGRRDCVAPEHLEAITFAEMNHRGENDALKNFAEYYERRRAATHCPNGHPWDEENTRRDEVQRYCRSCLRDSQRERRLDPAFRALEQSRARDLYVENRSRFLPASESGTPRTGSTWPKFRALEDAPAMPQPRQKAAAPLARATGVTNRLILNV